MLSFWKKHERPPANSNIVLVVKEVHALSEWPGAFIYIFDG